MTTPALCQLLYLCDVIISRFRAEQKHVCDVDVAGVCKPYRRHVTMTSQRMIDSWVEGVALFEDKVFVVCDQLDVISVYQKDSLELVGGIKVGGLQLANDLICCCQSRQLYVADLGHCVWRVSVDDFRSKKWIPNKHAPEDFNPLSLSVTSRPGQVLVTSYEGDSLSLYSGEGSLVTRVRLPSSSRARHAVQTLNDTYVVCRTLPRHDVIEVDSHGHVIRACGAELNWPRRLALSVNGDVIILDSGSNCMLLVDGQLRLKRILLSREEDGLKSLWRLSYTPDTGQLVVGEAWKIDSQSIGRVAVFRLI